jgi:membrane-bound serine protease (ClpP class)
MLAVPLLNLLLALIGAAVAMAVLARYLPKTSIYRRFALMTANPSGPSLTGTPREFATSLDLSPGAEGTSLSILRPSGKARFLDQIIDVVTQGEFIAPNTAIVVVRKDGMRVVVRAAQS